MDDFVEFLGLRSHHSGCSNSCFTFAQKATHSNRPIIFCPSPETQPPGLRHTPIKSVMSRLVSQRFRVTYCVPKSKCVVQARVELAVSEPALCFLTRNFVGLLCLRIAVHFKVIKIIQRGNTEATRVHLVEWKTDLGQWRNIASAKHSHPSERSIQSSRFLSTFPSRNIATRFISSRSRRLVCRLDIME